MKEEDGDKMSSTFVFFLIALVFSLSFLMVLVAVVCKKWKRRRAAKLSSSRLSLPPPYEVIALFLSVVKQTKGLNRGLFSITPIICHHGVE